MNEYIKAYAMKSMYQVQWHIRERNNLHGQTCQKGLPGWGSIWPKPFELISLLNNNGKRGRVEWS